MKKKFLNTKNVVIGLVSLVLIGASATGVAVFLKDRGEAAAAEQEQVQNLPATGRGEDNNQTGENTTIPSENNTTGDNTQKPTEPSTTEGATPGETTRPGTTGTTTRSRTEEAVAGIEETVRIEERKVFEDLKLSWTTLAIPAITADMGIFKPVLGIEKTATAVVRANQEEQIPVTENNKPMVRAGDTIIYTIKVSNSGNYKATNVVVTDSLDVIFDGKIVPANKELVKIETLDAGKQATLKVGYVVKQEDINAVLETEQNETISKDIINIATATDGKTTVEDEDDMPVNPDVTINVNKNWQDNDNQDGKRPEKITVELYRNNENEPVETVTIDARSDWKHVFSKLPKYDENKNEITYKVVEGTVPEYDTEYEITDNGVEIYNHHTPEKVSVEGSKIWDDADNQDGKRPSSIIVNLLADGEKVDSKTVTAENEWNWLFTDLNKYAKGREIQYTITEDKVENYITNIEKTENGYVVTNSYTPETTSISVEKVWEDKNNQDGVRPASIKVKLYMKILDNNIAVANKEPLELNASTFWKAEFKDLPKYAKGIEIKYIVKEVNEQADATIKGTEYKVAYDDPIINENGKYIKITNSYTPKTTSVSVEKVWEDKNNQDGVRPDSINVQLYKTVGTTTTSVEKVKLTNSKLTHTWTELPQYEKGTEIKYTVRELDSNGNPLEDGKQINGKSGTKYTVKYTTDENGKQIITNTYKRVTTSVSGTKTWVDYDNKYNSRPESITINLLANGEKVDSKTITPQNNSWTYKFENLPVYKNGQKITYTISEDTVSGYTSNVTGYNVTNTYTEAPTGTITMNWDTQSTTESPIPVDVVFVLDTSGSMTAGGSLRGTNMVTAVNNAIDEILRFNKNNRISVVGYSEYEILKVKYENAEHSSVLLPLGRYTANNGKNYLNKSENRVETNIQEYAKTRYFENGTFTQAGIQKGAEQLINSAGKTVKVDGKDVQRVPVIIIVSDGEPTVFSINYTSPLSESEKVLGTSQLANTSAVYGYYTILTANYFKQQVAKAYGTSAKVFTIAMDLTTHYGKTVLNPNDKNIGNCQNWIETDIRNQIEDKKISQKLYKYLNNFKQDIMVSCSVRVTEDYKPVNENVKVVKNPYSNYSYADKAFADDGMNADDLKRAMIGSITETVSNKKTHNIDENDRKIGKVYLDKIDITKDFKLEIAGGKTYTSYEDAKKDELVGFDGEKYYVDLTKLIGKTVTVNYRQK